MDKQTNSKLTEKETDLLEEYKSQTNESDDIHFEHYDWTYNDGSGCCC